MNVQKASIDTTRLLRMWMEASEMEAAGLGDTSSSNMKLTNTSDPEHVITDGPLRLARRRKSKILSVI
eukprot:11055953-Heterocapsa_arctica.AAC.1